MSWPTTPELEAVMVSDGIITAGQFQLSTIDRWAANAQIFMEGYTGWNPIFSNGNTSELRLFSPNGTSNLSLSSGLLSVQTVVIGSLELEQDKDFWLMGGDNRIPNNWIKFCGYVSGAPNTIRVVGEWGFTNTMLPADLLNAYYGLVEMQAWIALMPNEGPVSEKEQRDLRIRFANYFVGQDSSGKTKYDLLYENVFEVLEFYKNAQVI